MRSNKIGQIIFYFSIVIFGFFIFQALIQSGISWFVDFEFAANLGNTLAGILSFISVVLIYLSFHHQTETFYINQFENKFFEQIKIHRENVQNFLYESPESTNKDDLDIKSNHQVFISIFREILLATEYLDEIFTDINLSDIFISDIVQRDIQDRFVLETRKIDPLVSEKTNIAFLVVFFGVSQDSMSVLRNRLREKYNAQFVKQILDTFVQIPVKWSSYRKKFDEGNQVHNSANYVKYFGGHQHRLGHYYRHFYQSLNYINDQEALTYKQKYGYAKMLRAQLSTFEQGVLFFNSISDLGRPWELNNGDVNQQLITKYNFIKNIPAEFVTGIKVIDYYPFVHYEGFQRPTERDELEKQYL